MSRWWCGVVWCGCPGIVRPVAHDGIDSFQSVILLFYFPLDVDFVAEEASDKHGGDESHQLPCQDSGQCGEEGPSEDRRPNHHHHQLQPPLHQQERQLQLKRRGREEAGEIPDSQVRGPPDGAHQEETQSRDVDF